MKDNYNPNETASASQKNRILAFMKAGNSITAIQALSMFGSLRLGARIADIKADGYEVKSEFVKLPNGKQVKRYFMPAVQ